MIYRIYSDMDSFKELEFHKGLNILLAEKSPGATDRQTRNAAGKSSLIELIHFLMGANCNKNSIFKVDQLVNYSFGLDFDLKGARTIIERSGIYPSKVVVVSGETKGWMITPSFDRKINSFLISNKDWKSNLGYLMFNLKEEEEELINKFGPTFRSLFSYFVRKQAASGFMWPEKHTDMQQLVDIQVAISFFLDVDYTIAQEWQVVREREKMLKELRKAAGEGAFGAILGTSAELRTKLTLSEERARIIKESLTHFKILPEYLDLEKEASQITRQLDQLSNEMIIDNVLIGELQQSIEKEQAPSSAKLDILYKEAGVVFPQAVILRFEKVKAFHESIIENRKSYLIGEIEDTIRRNAYRKNVMLELSDRQTEIMEILQSHGALDQFINLQSELSRKEAEMEALRQKFIISEQLETGKTELDMERRRLEVRLRQDHHERSEVLKRAILIFEEISNALYENAGSLVIGESSNGPHFEVRIQGEKSKGINSMQIFCFDMMIMRLCIERGIGPGFLIHDSHLFDGVDERQVATALSIGSKEAEKYDFQYIVTLNSDVLPTQYPEGFNLEDHILPVRLTDATEDGGLFGLRF